MSATCNILVGDCRSVLASLPDMFSLIFADPPFNYSRPYGDHCPDNVPENDYADFTREWMGQCVEHLLPGGAFWVNIPDEWASLVDITARDLNLERVNWCIWHYRFGQNVRTRFIRSKVHAFYFVKPDAKRTWNESDILVPSDRASKYNDRRTLNKREGSAGLRTPLDVWCIENDGSGWGRVQGTSTQRRPGHDNQLPELYLERVVRACTNAGDFVCDPFLGSGTTCAVAKRLGRPSVGIELSPELAASATERIESVAVPVEVA